MNPRKPNPDLPIEQVPGKAEAIAEALTELLWEYYPQDRINGAQVFEMLDALAMTTARVVAQTGDHRPDFDQHFRAQLSRNHLIEAGLDPDED